jgi:hypothetical protein
MDGAEILDEVAALVYKTKRINQYPLWQCGIGCI